jgi:hypothetical protein
MSRFSQVEMSQSRPREPRALRCGDGRTEATITMSMREVDRIRTVQPVVDRMLPVGLGAQRLGLSRLNSSGSCARCL